MASGHIGKITGMKARSPTDDTPISALPHLGPKSQQVLQAAGIHNLGHLRALGSVRAYGLAKAQSPRVSLNLLWALEAALSGLHWQEVAREHRTSLLLALETMKNNSGTR